MGGLRDARLERGWSQAHVVDEILRIGEVLHERVAAPPSLKTLLSRWENEHAIPDTHYRRILSCVFGEEDLGFSRGERARDAVDEAAFEDSDSVLVPVAVNGGIHYVAMRRREVLAAGLGTALGIALRDADHLRSLQGRLRSFSGTVSQRLGAGRIKVADPALTDVTLRLPDADSFPGGTLPITLVRPGRMVAGGDITVALEGEAAARLSRDATPCRLFVTDAVNRADSFHVLGARAAVRQLRNSRKSVRFPSAYFLDDLTLGILWGAATFDQSLLDDDSLLAQRQANPIYRGFAVAPEVSDDLTADLSPVSRMWMGSEYCARYIVRNFSALEAAPRFWTREQRGQEACTWLFFTHKFLYLQKAFERSGVRRRSIMTRSFCIPETAREQSPPWERILLLLAVALMESLGIAVHVCTEPDLSNVDGIVISAGSSALVANWVRASNAWVTASTSDKSLLASYQDKIDFSIRGSVNAGDDSQQRLQSLCAYLGLSWHGLGIRCCQFKTSPPRGIYEPRSRLLSFAGLERALGFIETFHRQCVCQRRLASA